MYLSIRTLALCLALDLLYTASLQAQTVTYTLTDLGPVTTVNAISPDASTVVGSQVVAGRQTAFLLFPTTTTLGYLPQGHFSHANGVAGSSVVGDSSTGPFGLYTHAFQWTPDTGMQDLGTTGAVDLFSAATGINGAGTIVGYADSPDRRTIVPVMWMGGMISILPTLSAGPA